MKDIFSEVEEQHPQPLPEEQANTRTKKGHKKLSKGNRLILGLGGVIFAVVAVLYILSFVFGRSDEQETPEVTAYTSVTKDGALDTNDVSAAQMERLAQSEKEQFSEAQETQSSFVEDNIFNPVDAQEVVAEQKIEVTGAQAEPEQEVQAQTQTTTAANNQSQTTSTDHFDTGDNNYGNGNQRGNNSYVELKRNRIAELLTEISETETQTTSTRTMKQGNRMNVEKPSRDSMASTSSSVSSKEYDWGLSNTGNTSGSLDMNYGLDGAGQQKSTGTGRGLWVGDVLLGKVINGLKSTTPSHLMLVEIIQPEELAGAKLSFTPTVEYDNYVFSANSFNYKGNNELLNAIVVTPDANLSTGYRSDVNYHELYKWGMIFLTGVAGGAAEYVNRIGGSVAVSGETVVQSKEFDSKEVFISAAGGVANAASGELANAIEKEPTVWVHAGDIVGIMVAEDYNPQWFPFIPKHRTNILDTRQ